MLVDNPFFKGEHSGECIPGKTGQNSVFGIHGIDQRVKDIV